MPYLLTESGTDYAIAMERAPYLEEGTSERGFFMYRLAGSFGKKNQSGGRGEKRGTEKGRYS